MTFSPHQKSWHCCDMSCTIQPVFLLHWEDSSEFSSSQSKPCVQQERLVAAELLLYLSTGRSTISIVLPTELFSIPLLRQGHLRSGHQDSSNGPMLARWQGWAHHVIGSGPEVVRIWGNWIIQWDLLWYHSLVLGIVIHCSWWHCMQWSRWTFPLFHWCHGKGVGRAGTSVLGGPDVFF